MKYFRVIFKKDENGQCVFTDVAEQDMSEEDFQQMNWEKPIIRHEVNDHIHFLALESNYLEAMILGIGVYQKLSAVIE